MYDTAGIIASRIIKKYPQKKHVKVYYCPLSPENSCLEKGLRPGVSIILFLGIALLFITSYFGYNMLIS